MDVLILLIEIFLMSLPITRLLILIKDKRGKFRVQLDDLFTFILV